MVKYVNEIIERDGLKQALHHFTLKTDQDKKNARETATDSCNGNEKIEIQCQPGRTHFFLNKLISTANQNANREKGGYRYDWDIKSYATYLRTLAGPQAYDTLQKNLECALPSLSSTNRYIQSSNFKIFEGVLRSEQLLIYLEERNLPLVVSLSEDATRIVGKVQYHSSLNQIVGFTLPTNAENGMPIPFAFPARNADEIIQYFSDKNSVSSLINIIMAQPISKAPPFCLLLFGSDNKYKADDVSKRWKYITNELSKVNIKVLTISSDSDPKYNAAMRELSNLGSETSKSVHYFSCGQNENSPFFVQDTVHIITKLRNFFLRTSWNKKQLPFGNKFIKLEHLYELLDKFPKDQHRLTASILNPIDKQNFPSAQRMCDSKVISLLKDNVKDSEATIQYLQMMNNILESYMDPDLTPLERIRKIWYSVFIIRIWRQFIVSHKKYVLKDNFLTLNCFTCIELNAHSMVRIVLFLKKNNMSAFFLPDLFESQPCESMFRQFRSLTTTYSTVTNCTVKEATSRISKIQLLNEITHNTTSHFVYPRYIKNRDTETRNNFELPTAKEIFHEITKCEIDAIATAKKFKLITIAENKKKYVCKINPFKPKINNVFTGQNLQPNIIIDKHMFKQSYFKNIQLKDFSGKINPDEINENDPYVQVQCDENKKVIVKKTSLCWLLATDTRKLSSDRLYRVKLSTKSKISKRRMQYTHSRFKWKKFK